MMFRSSLALSLCLFASLGLARVALADFPDLFNSEPESQDTQMAADDAAEAMELPEGFQATVFASEPDVQNPIAMSWDSKGRLWVAENYTYAERGQRFQLDLRDRVVIFDNTRGNHFRRRTVFTDQVTMLTGLEVAPDGVYLMCPPQLIFIPDRNHDDIPDSPGEVVLDGFTVADANYHNFANGLRFGPDGWLYGRCGGSCPGRIGRPGTADHKRLAMEGGIWRYHPERHSLEVLTSGTTNPWGHDWNGVGELFFTNTVNGHLWHVTPGAHFVRPFLLDPNRRTYELIDFHADHWHFDTGQSWTQSRDGAANAFGGGHAHSGAMIYKGDQWPEAYRGNLFTLNLHGRRANQEILQREGSGYVAKHGEDFMLAADPWFRGMEMSAGPDGAVFVIDWSDTGECHEHTGVHRTSGRIFKVSYRGNDAGATTPEKSLPQNLRRWSNVQLARHHASNNHWFVRQARLELARRASENADLADAIETLTSLFQATERPQERVQSLLTLHLIGGAGKPFLMEQLHHTDEHVRVWAIRLLSETWQLDDTLGPVWMSEEQAEQRERHANRVLPTLLSLAEQDSSAMVRLALASTLQRLPVHLRAALAEKLVMHAEDAEDHNLPLMIWYGLIPVAEVDCDALADVASVCQLPTTLRLISRCLAEEIERHPDAINDLLRATAVRPLDFQTHVLTGMTEGLKGWRQAEQPTAWPAIAKLSDQSLQPMIRELGVVFGDGRAMEDVRAIALDKDAESSVRLSALQTLIDQQPADLREICQQLLSDSRMNVLAARGLSQFDDPEIGKTLVARYRNFRSPFRPQVISILVSRPSFAQALLEAIEADQIPRNDLSAYQVRQIHSFGKPELSRKVGEVWGEVRESTAAKQQQIAALKQSLSDGRLAQADLGRGRALFEKHCQNCHRLYGEGEQVGPDLTGSNRNNLDYLLSNVIDPSAVVDKNYRMTILLTQDDRIINGLVMDENERTLKVQTATEQLTFNQDDIRSRKITEKSPMPDGLIETLDADSIRDLFAYLRHPSQVPKAPETDEAAQISQPLR